MSDREPTTAATDPRAVGAHDCPRCGESYSLDGCACPTTTAAPWCPSFYRTATCLIASGHKGNHAGNDLDGTWLRWTDRDVTGIHKDPATGGSA